VPCQSFRRVQALRFSGKCQQIAAGKVRVTLLFFQPSFFRNRVFVHIQVVSISPLVSLPPVILSLPLGAFALLRVES
jgi:hypothetical protein